MNAVNLLPAKHRPRQASGGKQGSSFVLLGVLGAVVVAVLVYVMSVNSINDSKSKIAQAQAEAQRATAQADALGAYGDFAKVKQERVARVKQLADGRVDWERVLREVAHLLPNGVWVTSADGADSDASTTGGTANASTSTPATNAAAPTSPSITLQGCAPSQPAVAETIVRLWHLQGASDVSLDHSTRPDQSSSGSSSSSSSGSSSSSDCGETHGSTNYEFEVKVTLESPKPAQDVPGKVPASLGGGQ